MKTGKVSLVIVGPRCYVDNLPAQYYTLISDTLTFVDDHRFSSEDFRQGNWDGTYNFLYTDASQKGRLFFPFGLIDKVVEIFSYNNIDYDIIETYTSYQLGTISNDILPEITLRDYQVEAVNACLQEKRGIIHLPTGTGKTEIAAGLLKQLQLHGWKSLYIVDRVNYMNQATQRFEKRGLTGIGKYGDKYRDLDYDLVVGAAQTFVTRLGNNNQEVIDYLQGLHAIIFDEAHHMKANGWQKILNSTAAHVIVGTTATPFDSRRVGSVYNNNSIIGWLGPVIYHKPVQWFIEQGYLLPCSVLMVDVQGKQTQMSDWIKLNRFYLVHNFERNKKIVDIAIDMYEEGHKILIIVDQIQQGHNLLKMLFELGYEEVGFSSGSSKYHYAVPSGKKVKIVTESRDPNLVTRDFDKEKKGILIGSKIYNESVDLPSLSCLVVASGGKSPIQVIQRLGRALRLHSGLDRAYIIDFNDTYSSILMRQSKVREKVYEEQGHLIHQVRDWDVFRSKDIM